MEVKSMCLGGRVLIMLLICLGLMNPTRVLAFQSPSDAASEPPQLSPTRKNPSTKAPGARPEKLTDRLIVKYKDQALARSATVDTGKTRALSARGGVELSHLHPMSGGHQVFKMRHRMTQDEAKAVAEKISTDPGVEYAVPDRIMSPMRVPNDPSFATQWDFQSLDTQPAGINLPPAWDITTGSGTVVVGIIDTGIVNHADLQGRILPGYNFVSDPAMAGNGIGRSSDASDFGDWTTDSDGAIADPSSWHGTHVTGTVAATSNNGLGVTGINWNSKILPVRVLGHGGGYMSDVADGMRWAAGLSVPGAPANPNPARVINLSLGGYGSCDPVTQSAVNDVIAAGTVIVAAAGNDSADAANYTPAGCPGVIAVAAIDVSGGAADYSNYGPAVKIAAPGGAGTGILSTLNTGATSPVPSPGGDTYRRYIGTSMAAPHITGIVSLMMSIKPALTPAQVVEIVQATSRPFLKGTGGTDCTAYLCGSGMADAYAALQAVNSTAPYIIASPLFLDFRTRLGDPNPPSQGIRISNSGGGTLLWSASSNAPWLHVTPSGGQESETLTVNVDTTGLSSTTSYTGSITITAAGAANSVTIPVTLRFQLDLHAPIPVAVMGHAQAAVGGKVYVIGGMNATGAALNLVQIYDPASNTWSAGTPKPSAAIYINAAVIGNKIYVPGGYDGRFGQSNNIMDKLEIYDAVTNQWSSGAALPKAMLGLGAEAVNGKVYAFGGRVDDLVADASTYVYDPVANTWSRLADMNPVADFPGSGVVDGTIFTFGGWTSGTYVYSANVFDPNANSWSPIEPLNLARCNSGGAALSGKLYTFGGSSTLKPDKLQDVEVYDPGTNSWSFLPVFMNLPREGHKASVVGNTIYLMGGYSAAGFSSINESYTLPVNGVCGSSHGQTFSTVPTANLCNTGSATTVTAVGPEQWNWTCSGSFGGTTSSCSAYNDGLTIDTPPAQFAGVVGAPYSKAFTVAGGTPPYRWSIIAGALPAGLTLSGTSGVISGTPTASGSFAVTVQVNDSRSASASKQLTIAVTTVSITTSALPTARRTAPFLQTLSADGGLFPYTWSIADGTLPTGLVLNSATGTISGTPSGVGYYPFTARVTDATGAQSVKALSIRVQNLFSLAAANVHSLAVIGGSVAAWGGNGEGELGGAYPQGGSPGLVPGLSGVTTVAAGPGAWSSFALKEEGTLMAWGDNRYGQLGIGNTAVQARPVPILGPSQVVDIASGGTFTMALASDGTVWTWGSNTNGQLGDGTITQHLKPVQVPGLSGVVAIAAGGSHAVALKADGSVWTWGDNADGQLGDGTTIQRFSPVRVPSLSGVVALAAGYSHTMALNGDGYLSVWGSNSMSQLGDGAVSSRRTSPFQLSGLSGLVGIAAGTYHSMALKGDGTVWSWGGNWYGAVGDGTTQFRSSPFQIAGFSGVVNIAGGTYHSLAAKGDGTLWAWGANYSGELGDGTTITRTTPVRVNLNLDSVAPTTTASPVGGTYHSTQTVTLTANEAATIYYTLDGSTPTTASAVYAGPLAISSTKTLRYFAKDVVGNAEMVKTQTYIMTLTGPSADFSATATTGNAPFRVVFNDLSSGAPTSWLWSFGDGFMSTEQNPAHSYLSPGIFTVSLTASNAGGSGLTSKSSYITAIASGADSLQSAYSSALHGSSIRLWAGELTESPLFNRNIAVKISGGYDYFRQQLIGITTINGKIRVTNGNVILEGLAIK